MRVLFLGDSLTEGTVGHGFIPFLEELLPGNQYVNLGVNGETITGLRRRAERLGPSVRGDAAFVWIGTNDVLMYPDWTANADEAERDYRLLLAEMKPRAQKLYAVPPLVAEPGYAQTLEYPLGRAAEMMRRVGREAGATFVDIAAAFEQRPGREYTIDGAHLSSTGALLVAEVFAELIRRVPLP